MSALDSIAWDFPYHSKRMPVLASGVVATSQPLAAQAGLAALADGGNAADAAVAAAAVLTVVEPTGCGLGGDAFAVIWDGSRFAGLNGSGRSPAALAAGRFAGHKTMPARGWDAVTVPGAVSLWAEMSARFGRLGFDRLLASAIRYAREGFAVSPVIARQWEAGAKAHGANPEFREAFMPLGRAPRPGERFAIPDLGRTLEILAETGGEDLYRGSLAERIASQAARQGGALSGADLASHRTEEAAPLSVRFAGFDVLELPPNGQGIAALEALGILDCTAAPGMDPDSADCIHAQIEAMKLALADLYRLVADPAAMTADPLDLIDRGYLESRAALISMERAGDPAPGRIADGGTVYLAAGDPGGMMVSMIQSNYMGFGSGVVIGGTGISMQNRGACFTLEPGHPNEAAGGKKPLHTIIPAFVARDGKPVMSFGVMGGDMQPQGHMQVAMRVLARGQNPQAACDAPRWCVTADGRVAVEEGFPTAVLDDLKRRGHKVHLDESAWRFGGAQAVYVTDCGYLGASDPRKDGLAAGF